MSKIKIKCEWCGGPGIKDVGEVNRSKRIGRRLYCSHSCAAKAGNLPGRSVEIVRTCPVCGKRFTTTTRRRSAKHCSRSCASKGSMTPHRRQRMWEGRKKAGKHSKNISPEKAMQSREAWKNAALKEVLEKAKIQHTFEYRIGRYIFDLVLLDLKIVVEFDGPYHRSPSQQKSDRKKDKVAERKGFVVVRREVQAATVIHPKTIRGLF